MFFRKKKPVKKSVHGTVSHNAVFGDIRFGHGGWYTINSFPIDLFGKTYHITACARATVTASARATVTESAKAKAESKSEIEPINEEQEAALRTCLDIFKNNKAEVEQMITDRFKMADADDNSRDRYKPDYDLTDIASRFEPDEIDISRGGRCTLHVSDNAENYGSTYVWDAGFALSLMPGVKSDEEASGLKPWQDNIAVHFIVQDEVQKHDKSKLWEYYYPELAATEEQIAEVERHLGYPLDHGYRDFLRCANGWKCFTQSVNLFGTLDLLGSDLMCTALEALDIMDDAFPFVNDTGFSKEELLPIAATPENRTLHVITKPTAHEPGIVIWFDGQEIERYPNFEEYFLTMTDYNRAEIDALKKMPTIKSQEGTVQL